MTLAAIAIGGLVLTNALLVWFSWTVEARQAHAQAAWARERRELISRIQRPDYIPTSMSDPERFALSGDDEPDQIELINTIADTDFQGDE